MEFLANQARANIDSEATQHVLTPDGFVSERFQRFSSLRYSEVVHWEERSVEEVSVRAHSSFRIYLKYTPKKSKEESSNLKLHAQSFFLLFELRSKRDYGEIGLFCRAMTCQSRLTVTPTIQFNNCVPGGSFTKEMIITNFVTMGWFL